MPVYNASPDEAGVLVSATIVDLSNDQPLSEATVIIFADDEIQEQLKTWTTGSVDINVVPGKNYHLLIRRTGYSDKIVALGEVSSADQVEIALVPANIMNLRQSGANLDNANMLVMSGPTGEDQMYLATEDDLFQYVVENDNHYLVNDEGKILLKERSRSLGSKVNSRQDTDQYMLRNEDEFLYDQLTGDEKAMVDRIVTHMVKGDLESNSDLNIYYNNLPEEYRALVDTMVAIRESSVNSGSDVPSGKPESLDHLLAEKNMRVGETFNVNNIYYDFDKDEIREDAAIELNKLAAILQSNQHIKVSMFSHADSRGSNSYNDVLSKKRGISAINYLAEKGVDKDRLFMEAKGESQLVNSCADSTKCPEEAHQLNRRTEFILST